MNRDIIIHIFTYDPTYKIKFDRVLDLIYSPKSKALNQYLIEVWNCSESDCTISHSQSTYDVILPNRQKIQLLIFTDDEANKQAKNYLEQTLQYLDYDFLKDHFHKPIFKDDFDLFQNHNTMDINQFLLENVKDINKLLSEAILIDGRSHFISKFDDVEYIYPVNEIMYYLYRI